ncbi:hypothetical protein ABPG72_010321 [Tetrahymena utriculariae]
MLAFRNAFKKIGLFAQYEQRGLNQILKMKISNSVEEAKRQKENQIADLLKQGLLATYVKVEDTSVGGSACGQMYKMVVQSPLFNEKSRVEQHKMVNNVLSDIFKDVHGYNLKTLGVEAKKQEEAKQ